MYYSYFGSQLSHDGLSKNKEAQNRSKITANVSHFFIHSKHYMKNKSA